MKLGPDAVVLGFEMDGEGGAEAIEDVFRFWLGEASMGARGV